MGWCSEVVGLTLVRAPPPPQQGFEMPIECPANWLLCGECVLHKSDTSFIGYHTPGWTRAQLYALWEPSWGLGNFKKLRKCPPTWGGGRSIPPPPLNSHNAKLSARAHPQHTGRHASPMID